jgi:hypothetical protein
MLAIVSLTVIAGLSLIFIRLGATALAMTGLSRDVAEFQAYSAFTGVGYTTREAEMVVGHPVRRRIVRDLMLAGQVGVTSGAASLVVAFVQVQGTSSAFQRLGVILAALVVMWVAVMSPPARRVTEALIRWTLQKAGVVRPADYSLLLRVHEGYSVGEVDVMAGSAIDGASLARARLGERGVLVIGIERRGGEYVGTPSGSTVLGAGDRLTVYGRDADLEAMQRTAAVGGGAGSGGSGDGAGASGGAA